MYGRRKFMSLGHDLHSGPGLRRGGARGQFLSGGRGARRHATGADDPGEGARGAARAEAAPSERTWREAHRGRRAPVHALAAAQQPRGDDRRHAGIVERPSARRVTPRRGRTPYRDGSLRAVPRPTQRCPPVRLDWQHAGSAPKVARPPRGYRHPAVDRGSPPASTPSNSGRIAASSSRRTITG